MLPTTTTTEFQTITKEDLGDLVPCQNCGKLTYDSVALDKLYPRGVTLPQGFTAGNRRRYVWVRSVKITCCNNCRYYVFGSY